MADSDPTDRMVEVATCSSPYESTLVQGLLTEAGIAFITDEMSSQFAFTAGAAAVSRVRVAESDLERARQVLALGGDEIEEVTETPAELDADLRARRERRYRIARFFLIITALSYLATAIFAVAVAPIDAILHVAVGTALIGLVRWSYRTPRNAFLVSFFMVSGAAVWGMLTDRPFLIVPGLLVLFSSYFAYEAAKRAEETASNQAQS